MAASEIYFRGRTGEDCRHVDRDARCPRPFGLALWQRCQRIAGTARLTVETVPLAEARLRGEEIRVGFAGARGARLVLTGRVAGGDRRQGRVRAVEQGEDPRTLKRHQRRRQPASGRGGTVGVFTTV